MFVGLFRELGFRNPFAAVMQKIEPKELVGDVITPGDENHDHQFQSVGWDYERLGARMIDFDKDHGTALEFPMATLKDLHRCSCGREIITSTRSLI